MAQAAVNLVRPQWTTLRSIVRVLNGGAWLAILIVLLNTDAWFVLQPEAGRDGSRLLATANQFCKYSLAITAIASAISFVRDVYKLFRGRRS